MMDITGMRGAAGALALTLALAACGDGTTEPETACGRPGDFVVVAPADARQGELLELRAGICSRSGAVEPPGEPIRWSLVDSGAGRVDSLGRFVAYPARGTVQVVAAAGQRGDTAALEVRPRGLSGRFSTVGMGFVENRFTSDLWVAGNHAYTGTWNCMSGGMCGNALKVWDVQNPARPVLTDSVIVDARTVNDVKVSVDGRVAVLTQEGSLDRRNGITILSLADPAHPRVLTRYTRGLENGVHNVWIEGRYLYVVEDGSSAEGGLHVLDIADPAAPVEVAHFYAGSSFVHDVYVRNGLAFVSHWDAGLIILDVGNGIRGGSPSSPREVSRIRTVGGEVHNAWYWPESRYVFVGEEDFSSSEPRRVHVVDVQDLTRPVEVATFSLAGDPPHNFWLDEARGILFVGWYGNGLRAIDVSGGLLGELERQGREYASIRPSGPRAAASIWAPQLHRGIIFASDLQNGLWAFNFQTGG